MKATDWVDAEPEPSEQRADAIQRPNDGDASAPEQALGFILDEEDEKKVAKYVTELRTQQNTSRSKRRAVWKRNSLWRKGRRWVKLEKSENTNLWRAYIPKGMGNAPPVPNKTDRLCRRVVNTILVDQPYPECEAAGDRTTDKDAAEFATRYLLTRGSPAELNMNAVTRAAADKAMTFASGFAWATMDPHANGHRPRRMLAHPLAQSEADALLDPETQEPAPDDELTERYIRKDGALTDDPNAADLQWLPNHKIRLLNGLQVDFLPATARGISDCDGVLITDTTTLGELRAQFGDVLDGLSDDDLETLCSWRPAKVEDILPPETKEPEDQKYKDGPNEGQYRDEQMVVVTTIYYRSHSAYPFGAYAVIGGESLVLHRQKWTAMMPQPQNPDGSEAPPKEECLLIPVAQCRCLNDNVDDDPYGIGMAEMLGPMDEIRAAAFGNELEHMWQVSNPHTYLPIGTVVQPGQIKARTGEPIYYNPQGKPEREQIEPLSQTVPAVRAEMTAEMDDESGLQEAAQGVETTDVKSGIHAQTIVQQALKAVMELKDNVGDFYVRLNQIILQHARAYLTVPQLLAFTGKDGEYKAREFSRVDFGNTRIVSIQKGTFTMHTPAAKQQMADQMKASGAIDNEQYVDLITSGTSPILGQQDNPALLRVRRQLAKFRDGPPPEFMQAMQQYQMQMQQFQAAQQQLAVRAQNLAAQGIQSPAPQIPAPQKPPGPFDPRLPIDDEPMAAKIRHRQVFEAMASSAFEAFPPEWQQELFATYAQDKNAAGIMTVPDVQKQKQAELAAMPPALPKGVTIAMKGDASTVAQEEQAALQGFQGGGAPQQAPPAPVQAPVPHPVETIHERDEHGHLVRSVSRPVAGS